MIAIVDYGAGNVGSVARAFARIGVDAHLLDDPAGLDGVPRALLPGVGAFAEGMAVLARRGWVEALRAFAATGRPLLGICAGMQFLGSHGDEGGPTEGLGLVPGRVRRLDELGCDRRIPHLGWNAVTLRESAAAHPLVAGVPDGTDFYFAHSYALVPDDPAHVLATTEHGVTLTAMVAAGNVVGAQFHPEKSSNAGLKVLEDFAAMPPC